MSSTISLVYVQTYERNVIHLSQQGVTRLLPHVTVKSVHSSAHNWERLAEATGALKTAAGEATPDDDTTWSRRQTQPDTWHVADITGTDDIVQVIVDPNSNYARAHAMFIRRKHDDAIIEAAVGVSRDGAGAPIAYGAVDGITVGDGTTPISFDMVTEVAEEFMNNDVDPDVEKIWVVTPGDMRKLLQLTEATNADYVYQRALMDGYVKGWMGFTWIVSTRMATAPAVAPGSGVYNAVFTKEAIGFQMNQDVKAEIAKDPSASFDWRIYCDSVFGAIRVEDRQVVRVNTSGTV